METPCSKLRAAKVVMSAEGVKNKVVNGAKSDFPNVRRLESGRHLK